ncbi:DUF3500 domain-containing protein [Pedobacter sp. Du54]|uniref:DUF3500 domain-containing protein n=1 Tax=Pedobacter anseongensis TaxID=3133439 RepID=UPI00309CD38F
MKNLSFLLLLLVCFSACKEDSLNETSATADQKNGISKNSSVTAAAVDPCSAPGNVAKVTCLVQTFKASLTADQASALQIPLSKTNAVKWSGLTGGITLRNGVEFSTLTPAQVSAAKSIISSAAGITVNEGWDEFNQINLGDAYLGSIGGSAYGTGKYSIAVLGDPALEGTWMLQFGGHGYAQNITYKDGVAVSGSPSLQGTEPKSWDFGGVNYAPLAQEHDVMTTLLASLSTAQLASAKLASPMTDLMLGAGKDGQFPATRAGVKMSTLSSASQNNFILALHPWLNDFSYDLKTRLLNIYTAEMADTYISYSGNPTANSGNPNSFLMADGDYVRIDGPSVWIEFMVKKGTIFTNDVQYQTIYRDHTRDYNGL